MSDVVIPFVVLVGALVVMGAMLLWSMRKARGRVSPIKAVALARGWTYLADDATVPAPVTRATHVVRGRQGRLDVVAYEQYPAPGELYAVVEVSGPVAPTVEPGLLTPLREAFHSSARPRLAVDAGRLVVIQDGSLTAERLDDALARAERLLVAAS